MSYKINNFISSDIDVATYEKRLSICLSSNGFSFSLRSLSDELLAIGDVACNPEAPMVELLTDVKNAFAEMRMPPFGMKETELVVPSSQFVWMPQHLYDDTKKNAYLDALCKVSNGYGVYSDFNEEIKSYMIFSANNNQVSAFKIALPGLRVRCQHSKMVNSYLLAKSDMRSVLMINVREGESDYCVFCNKKLQMSNTFRCDSIDETIYHALNITKQFHLEDAAMDVYVCGEIDRDKYAKLRPYFNKVALFTGGNLRLTVVEMQHVAAYKYALILS